MLGYYCNSLLKYMQISALREIEHTFFWCKIHFKQVWSYNCQLANHEFVSHYDEKYSGYLLIDIVWNIAFSKYL